jgi:hypothetical protein
MRVWILAMLLLVPFLLVAAPPPSGGRSIFLNGQNIDTVRGQVFDNVSVEIDTNGNIHLKSDVYKVSTVGAVSKPTPVPEIPRGVRYWLVSEENAPGMSQYDFDVFVNGNLVKTVKSGEPQVVEDVTRFVLPGTNTVTITARKNFGAGRRAESKDFYMRVYIGKGELNETGAILIESADIDYRRTSAEVTNYADQLTFVPK